jgi:hypothetical protein
MMDRETGARESLAPLRIFDGTITVRGGAVLVTSVFDDEYILWPWPDGDVPLRIYTNDPREPDKIDIVVG